MLKGAVVAISGRSRAKGSLLVGLVVGLLLIVWATAQGGNSAQVPEPFSKEYYVTPGDRFGVGLFKGVTVTVNGTTRSALITDYAVDELQVGWYSDWRTNREPLRPGGIRYAQLVPVRASAYPTVTLGLTDTAEATPGSLWLVGNEPEAKYGQGKRTPGEYAQIYHDVYTIIKDADPSAWVAIGGVIQPTPLRLEWLDRVLNEYQMRYGQAMPVDVWNIHMQILNEEAGSWGAEIPVGLTQTQGRLYSFADNASPTEFCRLVIEFRQWMKARGLQDRPLIISEYGVLLPSSYLAGGDDAQGDQMVIGFMRGTFDFMLSAKDTTLGYPADDYRLVQQWLWYSLNDQPYDPATGAGFNGSLFSHRFPSQITQFGRAFRDYVNGLSGWRIMLPFVGKVAY